MQRDFSLDRPENVVVESRENVEKRVTGRERLIDRVKKGYCFFVIIYCGLC